MTESYIQEVEQARVVADSNAGGAEPSKPSEMAASITGHGAIGFGVCTAGF